MSGMGKKENTLGFIHSEGKLHKGIIKLGRPYLRQTGDGKSRLCAEFTMDGVTQELYFEVDKEWGAYFVTEYSDPFILAIIEKAMKHAYDIYFETPMSEDLYYSLVTYMIPVYARNIAIFHEIDLVGKTIQEPLKSLGKAGTGFSAGVDSFYTVLKHLDLEMCPSHNVTHLLLTLNGAAATGICESVDKEWIENSKAKLEPYAKELGMSLIVAGGNLDLLYAGDETFGGDVIMTASYVHALRKLFGIYYWGSAYPAEVFEFPQMMDAGFWENIAVSYVSVNGLRFYHSGSETNRIGKVAFIADNTIVQRALTVCGNMSARNCGGCVKCLRTMAELNAVGKLNLFEAAFPVKKYEKNLNFLDI